MALILRKPTLDDATHMLAVQNSAFKNSALNLRCFPASDPKTEPSQIDWIKDKIKLQELTLACDEEGRILGWSRWVRRPIQDPRPPKPIFTPDMYPQTGDPELAVRFFQTNVERMEDIVGSENVMFLSMLVVRQEAQRKGVGSALIKPGVQAADEEGWICYVNGTEGGKGLYEKFGFRTVETSWFADGILTHHMKREAKGTANSNH
ncbi:unnamed protein product [Clonostachys chloroleuca]|uniref:N-acetyltransferase domain-containing protein n=1 Tax=Clonostachys chloroleuca TaxID=1926264 RepID=A0AA35LYQ7_9HYPO|nr:unnamed protein product [Clonostachys chloroleuca]